MAHHVHLRVPAAVLARVEELQRARGLRTRSEAIRAVIREASMEPPAPTAPIDRGELLGLLTAKARDGSVPAIRVLLDELRRDAASDAAAGPSSPVIDELASKRSQKAPT